MPLQKVWKQFLEARASQLVLRERVIVVEAWMQSTGYYYGVKSSGKMLRHSDIYQRLFRTQAGLSLMQNTWPNAPWTLFN